MAETAPLAAVKRTRWKRTMGGRGRLSRLGHSMLRWGPRHALVPAGGTSVDNVPLRAVV